MGASVTADSPFSLHFWCIQRRLAPPPPVSGMAEGCVGATCTGPLGQGRGIEGGMKMSTVSQEKKAVFCAHRRPSSLLMPKRLLMVRKHSGI